MEDFRKAVFPTLFTFVLTLAVTTLISYYTGPRGEVSKTEGVFIAGKEYTILDIRNYSSSTLNGLTINIPIKIELNDIDISTPLSVEVIKNVVSSSTHKQIMVSGIPPNNSSKLILPASSGVAVVNHEEKNMDQSEHGLFEDPIDKIIFDAFLMACVYSLLFFIFETKQIKREKNIEKNRDLISKELSDVKKELEYKQEKIAKELHETRNHVSRTKILLMARLHDYSRELEFWRNTIRKVIYRDSGCKKEAESIIDKVTEELKTYQTRVKDPDECFKAVECMSSMLSKK